MKVAFVLMGGNQTCKQCLMMESSIAGIKVCVFVRKVTYKYPFADECPNFM